MATLDDLKAASSLCANAADAALHQLMTLGPRPNNPSTAAAWDFHDTLLKNKISTLNNLSASMSALAVVAALEAVWPHLEGLQQITADTQSTITRIKDVSNAIAALATIVTFGVAVMTLATQPSPSNVSSLLAAFKNMRHSL